MDIEKYFDWFDHFEEGVYFVTPERKIIYFNQASEIITGFTKDEVMGSYCYDNILNHVAEDGRELCFEGCPLLDSIKQKRLNRAEVYLHHKEGHRVKVRIKTFPVIEDGETVGALELFSPVDKENLFNKSLEYYKKKAMTDSLTKLNNRSVLDEHVPELMESSEGVNFGVVFGDIDNFKTFNDTYGHAIGDKVLEVVSRTLEQTARKSDIVIRYGGEEFMVLVYDITQDSLKDLAERFRRMVETSSVSRDREELTFTMSLGATMIKHDETLDDAVKRADEAMYESKKTGRNKVTVA